MTWRHADGFHPHIVQSLNNNRRLRHISLSPLSPSLSVHLCASQDGQSFPLLNRADAQGGPQENNGASMSLQRTSTRKVSGTRRAAQGTRCTWNVRHNDDGEQGQRNATHPNSVITHSNAILARHTIESVDQLNNWCKACTKGMQVCTITYTTHKHLFQGTSSLEVYLTDLWLFTALDGTPRNTGTTSNLK